MATPVVVVWVTRARCPTCGEYIWSDLTSGNINCLDGGARIADHVREEGELGDDSEFRSYVCLEVGVADEDLVLTQGI